VQCVVPRVGSRKNAALVQCIAVCCSVSQCAAVQCVAVCYITNSVLQSVAVRFRVGSS